MSLSRRAALGLAVVALATVARAEEKFRARLYPVPIDATLRAEITGNGFVAAVLDGHRLSVAGTFEGLKTPATTAQIHQGPATGVRGPAILDLIVSKGTMGSITGTANLNDEQLEMLRKGRLYIQLQSEKAPDGNLWGWLLH